jgi:hypothetical protein
MASDTNTSTPSTPNSPPPEITIMSPSSPPPTSSSPSSPHGINGTAHGPVAAAVSGTSTPSRTPRSGTPITTHLTLGGKNHKILDKAGYTDIRFPGKEEQFRQVVIALKSKGFIPNDLVEMEVLSTPHRPFGRNTFPHAAKSLLSLFFFILSFLLSMC